MIHAKRERREIHAKLKDFDHILCSTGQKSPNIVVYSR